MLKISSNIVRILCAFIWNNLPDSIVIAIWFCAGWMLFSSLSLIFLPQ